MPPPALALAATRNGASIDVPAIVRRHGLGIAAAILLALALVGPRWWLLATSPAQGDRVQISPWGAGPFAYDQSLYMPNIRDAYDGQLPVTQPYGGGEVDTPAQTGSFWLQAIGSLGEVTGGIFSAFALVTTLMAILAFIALYALGISVTGSRLASLAFIAVALFFTYIMTVTGGLIALRRWSILEPIVDIDPRLTFHPWIRFIAPIIPLPALFAALIAVPRALDTGRRSWIIAAAATCALLVYAYLFYWIAFGLALAAWAAWLLYQRDINAVRRLLVIGALAAVMALPELVGLTHTTLTSSDDIRDRLGTGVSASFDRVSISVLVQRFAIGIPFMLACMRGPQRNRLFIAMYIVPLILARATVGLLPQPAHFIDYVWPTFALPLFLGGGTEMYRTLNTDWQRRVLVGMGLTALACAGWFGAFQVRAEREVDAAFAMPSDEYAAFSWLDRHATTGDVVASPSISTNLYLAAMTPAQRYVLEAFVAAPSDDQIIERYLRVSAAFGYSEADTFARIDPYDTCRPQHDVPCEDAASNFPFRYVLPLNEREADLEWSMAYYLLNWEIVQPSRITDRIPAWRDEFARIAAEPDPLAGHPATYLYCGPRERLWPASHPATAIFATVAFQQGEATIYRLAAQSDAGAVPFHGC